MNFLAHFLLTDPLDSPEYQLGGLLPDIAKRAGILIKPAQLEYVPLSFLQLKKGIELHWKADRLFHNSKLFGFGMELWKKQLHAVIPTSISKTFFLYHLLFEMWLDRVLMMHQIGSDQAMYSQLEQVNLENLKAFASQVLDDQKSKLIRSFQGFQSRRFVSQYRQLEGFSEIAVDVFNYVTDQSLNGQFKDKIERILVELEVEETGILVRWNQLRSEILA